MLQLEKCVFSSSNVKDINSVLEVTVYDEDRDHKVEFLGKVAIPLLSVRNGEKKWYCLKDKKLRGRAKGNCPMVLLEMHVVWNPVNYNDKLVLKIFNNFVEGTSMGENNQPERGEIDAS